MTPKRIITTGEIASLKIKAQHGKKIGEAIVTLASGKRVKALIKGTLLDCVLTMGKNIPSRIAFDKVKGETPWMVAIQKA